MSDSESKAEKAVKIAGLLAFLGGASYAWWRIASEIRNEIEKETA